MSEYFSILGATTYSNTLVTDISRRARIVPEAILTRFTYLPYTVEEDETAESIALNYYGSTDFVWLVYFSNGIVDPYTEWPMAYDQLVEYVRSKYLEAAAADDVDDPLEWALTHVAYYEDVETKVRTNPTAIDADIDPFEPDGVWSVSNIRTVTYFDMEDEANEGRRNIFLLNRIDADAAEKALRELMS